MFIKWFIYILVRDFSHFITIHVTRCDSYILRDTRRRNPFTTEWTNLGKKGWRERHVCVARYDHRGRNRTRCVLTGNAVCASRRNQNYSTTLRVSRGTLIFSDAPRRLSRLVWWHPSRRRLFWTCGTFVATTGKRTARRYSSSSSVPFLRVFRTQDW